MKELETLDIAFLKRYDTPGPRYTSYPTAPAFSPDFGPEAFKRAILKNNQENPEGDISLYFHIPFCDTLCYFCGCTMLVTRDLGKIEHYLEALKAELTLVQPLLSDKRKVCQLHLGGGTPSYLSPDQIHKLMESVYERFSLTPDAELGVEIDPRGLTREHMRAFRETGFNRVSMGIQDFDEEVQRAVNRIQPLNITKQAIDWSRELGFHSINVDLIYGLPSQKPETFEDTLKKVIELAPDRIAVFNFAYVPWLKPHQRVIPKESLPSLDTKFALLKLAIETLSKAGYVYIGMDHFAKPGDELAVAQTKGDLHRNFQGYSTKAHADLYAFGMSSISQFGNVYAQNEKNISGYESMVLDGKLATIVGYTLNRDDEIRRFTIMRLMCTMDLDKQEIERRFGIVFDTYFAEALDKLAPFEKEGLIELRDDRIIVHPLGRLIVRNVAMCFDAYLERLLKEKPVFSRTV